MSADPVRTFRDLLDEHYPGHLTTDVQAQHILTEAVRIAGGTVEVPERLVFELARALGEGGPALHCAAGELVDHVRGPF